MSERSESEGHGEPDISSSHGEKRTLSHNSPLINGILQGLQDAADDSLLQCEFVVSGEAPQDLISLFAAGVTIGSTRLGMPIYKEHLDRFFAEGTLVRAPFGRGETTVTDVDVRRTWQVSPSGVSFENPTFLKDVSILAERAAKMLGVEKPSIVNFHKLLIYDEGDFFKPHRDAVHSPNQFATLVIQLPSVYQGGQLEVSTTSQHSTIDQSGPGSAFKPFYTMFFSDCLHEVKPITKGIRVCLTFDVCYVSFGGSDVGSKTDADSSVQTKKAKVVNELTEALRRWATYHSEDYDIKGKTCHCGQKVVPKLSNGDDDEYDEYDTNDFPKLDASETCLLVIPLEHLLPKNELQLLFQAGDLENGIWAYRGADRAKITRLVEARNQLRRDNPNMAINLLPCHLSYEKGHEMVSFEIDSPDGDEWSLCECMVQCLSDRTAHMISSQTRETGNAGEVTESKYQSVGIFMYPQRAKARALEAIAHRDFMFMSKLVSKGNLVRLMEDDCLLTLIAKECMKLLSPSNNSSLPLAQCTNIFQKLERSCGLSRLVEINIRSLVGRRHEVGSDRCWCCPSLRDSSSIRLTVLKAAVAMRILDYKDGRLEPFAGLNIPEDVALMLLGCLACQWTTVKNYSALGPIATACLVPHRDQFAEILDPFSDLRMLLRDDPAQGSILNSIRMTFVRIVLVLFNQGGNIPRDQAFTMADVIVERLCRDVKEKTASQRMAWRTHGLYRSGPLSESDRLLQECFYAALEVVKLPRSLSKSDTDGRDNVAFSTAVRCVEALAALSESEVREVLMVWFGKPFFSDHHIFGGKKPVGDMLMRTLTEHYCNLVTARLDVELSDEIPADEERFLRQVAAERNLGKLDEILAFLRNGQGALRIELNDRTRGWATVLKNRLSLVWTLERESKTAVLTRDINARKSKITSQQNSERDIVKRLREKIAWE